MAATKLDKSRWSVYFDHLSKELLGKRAEVEVAGIPLGDQIEAEWLPLLGIVYDHKNDLLQVILGSADAHLDHMIRRPREIYVSEGAAGLENIVVLDGDDLEQILTLRDPLMLPAPSQAAH
jgi:hypothetical protein